MEPERFQRRATMAVIQLPQTNMLRRSGVVYACGEHAGLPTVVHLAGEIDKQYSLASAAGSCILFSVGGRPPKGGFRRGGYCGDLPTKG